MQGRTIMDIRRTISLSFLIGVFLFFPFPLTLTAKEKGKSKPVGETVVVEKIAPSEAILRARQYQFSEADNSLLNQIEKGCFQYFTDAVGEPAGLALDKTTDTICSVAAVGFQLSAMPIGVERGWISRDDAEQRVLKILHALVDRTDNKKQGIYLHYIDSGTGGKPDFSRTRQRYEVLASTIDHALMQAGAMVSAQYFGGKVAELTNRIIHDANWQYYRYGEDRFLSMGWKIETEAGVDGLGKLLRFTWKRASDEERIIYFLATGAPRPEHAVPAGDYYRLERSVERYQDDEPHVVSWNGALFMYFFSHCWIDYGAFEADNPTAFGIDGPDVDWFENSRRAAITHRRRCIEAAELYPTLGENRWGLAPCAKENGYCVQEFQPNLVDNDRWCDGIVPPYGAASVLPMVPRESMAALHEYRSLKRADGNPLVWRDPDAGGYGFLDAFQLDPPRAFEVNLGIDQGPMLLAIENARTGLIWRLFMEHPVAKSAVERLKWRRRSPTTKKDDVGVLRE